MEENNIEISFLNGASVRITGNIEKEYCVTFLNEYNQRLYKSELKNNMWAGCSLRFFNKWKIIVESNGTIIKTEVIDLKNKRVKIEIECPEIREVFPVIEVIDRFQKIHECILDCIVLDEDLRKILEKSYKNIRFLNKDNSDCEYYTNYKILNPNELWEFYTRENPSGKNLKEIALDTLGLNSPKKMKEPITLITAHPHKPEVIGILKKTLMGIKTKILLSVNCPVDKDIQELCDYVIYDKENPILKKSEYGKYAVGFFWQKNDGTIVDFEFEHSYAVYKLISNGLELANSLGYSKIHYYNYDCQLSDETLKEQEILLDEYDFVSYVDSKLNHGIPSYEPAVWAGDVQKMLDIFRKYKEKKYYYMGGVGGGLAPCSFLDIKLSYEANLAKLKIKELSRSNLIEKNKINLIFDKH